MSLCEVWSAERGLPSAKPKAVFHYTCGELPPITKKAARALYDEVRAAPTSPHTAVSISSVEGRDPVKKSFFGSEFPMIADSGLQ